MAATSYDPPQGAAPGASVDHFAGTITREPHADTGAMAPAGQFWSTVGDLLRWADFLATGHPDVLAGATVAEMRTPATPGGDYALGLRVRSNGDPAPGRSHRHRCRASRPRCASTCPPGTPR